jgi:hypothetical protein
VLRFLRSLRAAAKMDQDPSVVIITGLAVALAQKVFGRTFDLISDEVSGVTQQGIERLKRVFENANKKSLNASDSEAAVPMRVAAKVIQEARFSADELMVEYFGGVLASSRTRISRDDRIASLVSLISRLSAYQLRTHYILYRTIKRLFDGTDIEMSSIGGRAGVHVLVPLSVYNSAMEFSVDEDERAILDHAMAGLLHEDLVEHETTWSGHRGDLVRIDSTEEGPSILVSPSIRGIELFLGAYGFGQLSVNQFLSSQCRIYDFPGMSIPEGARSIVS